MESGWIISSNLEAFLMVKPAEERDINYQYKDISEKNNFLMPFIAKQLGIDSTVYYKAVNKDGSSLFLTKNFINEDESIIRGSTIVKGLFNRKSIDLNKLIEGTNKFIKKHYKKYKLPESDMKEAQKLIRQGLIKQTVFSKLVFNQNEGNSLWGLVEGKDHRLRLAPIFNYDYCANVQPTEKKPYRTINKKETLEDFILHYSKELWFKEWIEKDLVNLDLNNAQRSMEKKTGISLTDTELEYYNFVIMEKMHSKVVKISDLDFDQEKVQRNIRKNVGISGLIRRAIPFFKSEVIDFTPPEEEKENDSENDRER